MKILVINSGSSSLKYQLIDTTEGPLAKGIIEKIGSEDAVFTLEVGKKHFREVMPIGNHNRAVEIALTFLLDQSYGIITCLNEIEAIGHRVVHGGESFRRAVLIDDLVLAKIDEYSLLAPLHNPANVAGIRACAKVMPNVPQVAVFDTAFHQSLPPKAYLYGLPYDYYEKYKIRRYGFHGTSHQYVSQKAAEFLQQPLETLKIISCHLGNGASIAAINSGRVVDTSMGFTPLEGLMMGTRSGSFDPAVVLYLMKHEHLTAPEMDYILNKKSGLLGVSGISNDFRDIEEAIKTGDQRAILAKDMYVHIVRKTIGSYAAVLNGLDVLIFTAGLGENGITVRAEICAEMDYLGIAIDLDKNNCRAQLADISASKATVKTLIIPTDEEAAIAKETEKLVQATK